VRSAAAAAERAKRERESKKRWENVKNDKVVVQICRAMASRQRGASVKPEKQEERRRERERDEREGDSASRRPVMAVQKKKERAKSHGAIGRQTHQKKK